MSYRRFGLLGCVLLAALQARAIEVSCDRETELTAVRSGLGRPRCNVAMACLSAWWFACT